MGTTLYVVREKVDKSGKETLKRYYGIPITSGQITTDRMARDICERCSLTHADVVAAVSALSEVMQGYLEDGHTVNLTDIGIFSVSASGEGCSSPNDCTPSKVKANRVCFKADGRMRFVLDSIKYQRAQKKNKK